MTDPATDALDQLPSAARSRLEQFSRALERVHVDDLPLYATRARQPDHRRAVEAAALAAREAGLEASIDAARAAVIAFVGRQQSAASLRFSYGFEAAAPSGRPEDWVRVMRSLGDAVTGVVLWDRLNEWDRLELLGEWARLLP